MEYSDTTVDDLYTIIKKFVYTATGYPAYTERKKFIKPKTNYATVYIMSFTNTGDTFGNEYDYDSDGYLIRYKNFNVQVTVRLYGDGSFNKMLSLENYFASSTEYESTPYFEEDVIALLKMQMVTDVSVPIDQDNWEERAQSLMTFNTALSWVEDVGEINSVTISTTVDGDSNTISGTDEIDSDGIETVDDSDGSV